MAQTRLLAGFIQFHHHPFQALEKGFGHVYFNLCLPQLFVADCFKRHTGHNWQTYWIPFLAYRCAYTHLRITSIPRCTPRNSQVSALFYNCWWASELCRLGRWIQVGGGHGILHQVLPTLAHLWLWKRTVDAYHVQTSKVVNHTTTWYPAAHFRLKLVVCL